MDFWSKLDKFLCKAGDVIAELMEQSAKSIDRMSDKELEAKYSISAEEMRQKADTMHMQVQIHKAKKETQKLKEELEGEIMFGKSKKLKKISYDTVSYIRIETEAICDYNDKQMISSYCLHKLELVNWYIELLKVGSEKYLVPQSLQELETIRSELKKCHEEIMRVKITRPSDRPTIDIKYPKGYEGYGILWR